MPPWRCQCGGTNHEESMECQTCGCSPQRMQRPAPPPFSSRDVAPAPPPPPPPPPPQRPGPKLYQDHCPECQLNYEKSFFRCPRCYPYTQKGGVALSGTMRLKMTREESEEGMRTFEEARQRALRSSQTFSSGVASTPLPLARPHLHTLGTPRKRKSPTTANPYGPKRRRIWPPTARTATGEGWPDAYARPQNGFVLVC